MEKENSKKFKRNGNEIGQSNAKIKKVKVPMISPTRTIIPASALTYPAEAEAAASDPVSSNGSASQGKENKSEKTKSLSGFIFMCNRSTKSECYQYHVFGLPLGKKDVVEEIKPGAKLFLYDFEVKLLYGIYEATSAGNLNLEPAAFSGKFPAQVKFKIFKECLPMPGSSLRHVIRENYTGSKFKQELSKMQVRKLLSSFHPLAMPSSQPAQALANATLLQTMPPSTTENQFKHIGRLPVMEVPYLAEMKYRHTRTLAESQPVPMVNYLQHRNPRAAAYVEHGHPALDHRSLLATSGFYVANSQQPSFAESVAREMQEEPPYSRYRSIEESSPHAQGTSLERYTTVELRVPRDEITIPERQYHQLTLQREAIHQDNVAAYNSNPFATAQHTSSAVQMQVHAPYHPLPLQRGAQYQDGVPAYSFNPAAQAPYAASVSQPQVPANNHNATVAAQYTLSVTQPQVLPHAPITSYYSYSVSDQLSHRS